MSFFEGKKKTSLADYQIARLDWNVCSYVDSMRFTMSNGDISPKYGNKPFTDCCHFESRVTKIQVSCKDNRIVGLVFYTEHDGEFLRITGSLMTNNTVVVDLHAIESLIGFKMRVAKSVLQGMSFTVLTSKTLMDERNGTQQWALDEWFEIQVHLISQFQIDRVRDETQALKTQISSLRTSKWLKMEDQK